MHNCLKWLKGQPKLPRPRSVKADIEAQNEWKATGLAQALQGAEMATSHRVWFGDEMRFGLWGQTRKRWGLRGLMTIQPIQIEFAWQDLVLAVDVVRCRLYWAWADRMNQTGPTNMRQLNADKLPLNQLIGWQWIHDAFSEVGYH